MKRNVGRNEIELDCIKQFLFLVTFLILNFDLRVNNNHNNNHNNSNNNNNNNILIMTTRIITTAII